MVYWGFAPASCPAGAWAFTLATLPTIRQSAATIARLASLRDPFIPILLARTPSRCSLHLLNPEQPGITCSLKLRDYREAGCYLQGSTLQGTMYLRVFVHAPGS